MSAPVRPQSLSKSILVIDDDAAILEALTLLLSSVGYRVSAWPTYTGTLLGAGEPLPDLIVLDMLLSGQDGRDIARALKGDPVTKKIPIVMMSAHPHAAERILEESRADAYLAKPFDVHELLAVIAAHM